MSVRMMSMVFDRYPEGGGEYVLALALADHAHEDGSRIWPGVDSLAKKSRQSARTVQRQLIAMQESGWLLLVKEGGRGPKDPNEYRINPDWIAGADFDSLRIKGDILSPLAESNMGDITVSPIAENKGDKNESHEALRVTKNEVKGDIAVSPEPSGTIILKSTEVTTTERARELLAERGVFGDLAEKWLGIRLAKEQETDLSAVELIEDEAKAAGLSFLQAIECCCKHDWAWFKAKWYAGLGTATKLGSTQPPPKPSAGWDWRSSAEGVLNRGRRLGIERLEAESDEAYRVRVMEADRQADRARFASIAEFQRKKSLEASCSR